MIEKLLNIIPKNEDSADALAIAISAHHIKNYNDVLQIYKEQIIV